MPLPQPRSIRNYSVAYFGNDWFAENRTSSHHIAKRLAKIVPVLYIETPGVRAPQANVRDFRKLVRKLGKMFASPQRVDEGLHVMTMPQFPWRRLPMIGAINRLLGWCLVRRALRKLAFRDLITWFVVPHAGSLAGTLGETLTVYYCIDDYAAFPGVDAAAMQRMDDDLSRAADIVFVASPALLEAKRAINPRVHFSPHGVDVKLFAQTSDAATEPAEAANALRHPVIGYFGSLGKWIDYDLLLYLARSRPQWTFLFVGYSSAETGRLRECANVVLAGPQKYETLPRWARVFDVAIIPYRLTQQVKNANPLKLREYLATGKPVVSVTTPETARFAHVLYLADTPQTYLEAVEAALTKDTPEKREQRMKAVEHLSWDARFQETVALVEESLRGRKDAARRHSLGRKLRRK